MVNAVEQTRKEMKQVVVDRTWKHNKKLINVGEI